MTIDSFQDLLADLRASGLPQKRYCRERGVCYTTFQYWLRKTRASKQPHNSGFLRLVPIPPVSEAIEVRFPNGAFIAVRSGFDVNLLRAVASALVS